MLGMREAFLRSGGNSRPVHRWFGFVRVLKRESIALKLED
jgi:hypothetical protein